MTKRADVMDRARRRCLERAEANARSRATAEVRAITAASAPKASAVETRDGLEWLIRKRKVTFTPERQAAAWFYRSEFRHAGTVSIASTLGSLDRVDSSGRMPPINDLVDAASVLSTLRTQVLRSQSDMLTVMDGVAGLGWTLRALAGGDDRRAAAMEHVLFVALDLVADWRLTNARKTEHQKPIPIRAPAERPSL